MHRYFPWILSVLCIIAGGIPLLIYPFVLLANIMSLAATVPPDTPLFVVWVGRAFLLSTTFYPVVYFLCVIGAVALHRNRNDHRATGVAAVPLAMLAAIALFVLGSMKLGG